MMVAQQQLCRYATKMSQPYLYTENDSVSESQEVTRPGVKANSAGTPTGKRHSKNLTVVLYLFVLPVLQTFAVYLVFYTYLAETEI